MWCSGLPLDTVLVGVVHLDTGGQPGLPLDTALVGVCTGLPLDTALVGVVHWVTIRYCASG